MEAVMGRGESERVGDIFVGCGVWVGEYRV